MSHFEKALENTLADKPLMAAMKKMSAPAPCSAVPMNAPTLKSLARAFGKVASNRRDLADTCVHKDDRDRSLMRALICMDIAEALEIAAQNSQLNEPSA